MNCTQTCLYELCTCRTLITVYTDCGYWRWKHSLETDLKEYTFKIPTCHDLCLLGNFACIFAVCWYLLKSIFLKSYFRNTIRVSNSSDPDQARHLVGPDLVQNCLKRLSAEDTSRQIVKVMYNITFANGLGPDQARPFYILSWISSCWKKSYQELCWLVFVVFNSRCLTKSSLPTVERLPAVSLERVKDLGLKQLLYTAKQTLCPYVWFWAATCDFQQCGILTSVDSDQPVQPHFKLRNCKWCSAISLTLIEYSRDYQRLWLTGKKTNRSPVAQCP